MVTRDLDKWKVEAVHAVYSVFAEPILFFVDAVIPFR
jgi:hypothetical protein